MLKVLPLKMEQGESHLLHAEGLARFVFARPSEPRYSLGPRSSSPISATAYTEDAIELPALYPGISEVYKVTTSDRIPYKSDMPAILGQHSWLSPRAPSECYHPIP